jgi:hypothetical protein
MDLNVTIYSIYTHLRDIFIRTARRLRERFENYFNLQINANPTEMVGIGATLLTCVRDFLVGMSAEMSDILTDGFRSFPHSLQANARVQYQSEHDRFLLNVFQFTIHQSSTIQYHRV